MSTNTTQRKITRQTSAKWRENLTPLCSRQWLAYIGSHTLVDLHVEILEGFCASHILQGTTARFTAGSYKHLAI